MLDETRTQRNRRGAACDAWRLAARRLLPAAPPRCAGAGAAHQPGPDTGAPLVPSQPAARVPGGWAAGWPARWPARVAGMGHATLGARRALPGGCTKPLRPSWPRARSPATRAGRRHAAAVRAAQPGRGRDPGHRQGGTHARAAATARAAAGAAAGAALGKRWPGAWCCRCCAGHIHRQAQTQARAHAVHRALTHCPRCSRPPLHHCPGCGVWAGGRRRRRRGGGGRVQRGGAPGGAAGGGGLPGVAAPLGRLRMRGRPGAGAAARSAALLPVFEPAGARPHSYLTPSLQEDAHCRAPALPPGQSLPARCPAVDPTPDPLHPSRPLDCNHHSADSHIVYGHVTSMYRRCWRLRRKNAGRHEMHQWA